MGYILSWSHCGKCRKSIMISLFCLSSGSESCSSVGSSSSSLSRPQLPLPASASSWTNIPSAPLIHPAPDTRGSGHPEMIKSVPSQPPSATDATNYYVLPLEASGIPPGSVLVNPHTGGWCGEDEKSEFLFKNSISLNHTKAQDSFLEGGDPISVYCIKSK